MKLDRTVWQCLTLYEIMQSIFNVLKQHRDNFQFGRRLFFLPRNRGTCISSNNCRYSLNLAKVIGNDRFGYRQELEQFCLLLLRCREPKEMSAFDKCFWVYGYLGSDWANTNMTTMEPSLTTVKTVTACKLALH